MSGLPFMLQGWNRVFYKTREVSDGAPVYRLDPYTLYWFFNIIGVSIKRVKNCWVMKRDCDYEGNYYGNKYRRNDVTTNFNKADPTPLGSWSYGGKVTDADQEQPT
jgi:hypothetical protein